MSRIIGIDLGTTNSLAAVWQDGKSVLVPNAFGDCFQGKRIPADLYRYLRKQIVRIQNYDEERQLEASASLWEEWNSLEDAIGYAAGKIDAAHYTNIGKQVKEQGQRKKREKRWNILKAFLMFLTLMMLVFGIFFLILYCEVF